MPSTTRRASHTTKSFTNSRKALNRDWNHASKAANGKGLEDGLPHFGPASTTYDKLITQGKLAMAKALEIIINNRSWCGSRLFDAGIIEIDEAVCTRCGLNLLETPHHRYYTCPANEHIAAEEVTPTQH